MGTSLARIPESFYQHKGKGNTYPMTFTFAISILSYLVSDTSLISIVIFSIIPLVWLAPLKSGK